MMSVKGERGSALVLVLAVTTALAIVTSALLHLATVVMRRDQSAWSSVVTLSEVQSLGLMVVDGLVRHPTASCADVTAWTLPVLGNGAQVTVICTAEPPQPWTVTVSATHGRRISHLAMTLSLDAQGQPLVHMRSVLTGPNPALTNAA